MDAPAEAVAVGHYGLQQAYHSDFPNVRMHFGLAGQDRLPAETFDIVLSISAIEHTYDTISPVDPKAPLAHVEALRDMCRVLRPGGLLLFNWDKYLD
jgi:SAM-dependent methyltransferase